MLPLGYKCLISSDEILFEIISQLIKKIKNCPGDLWSNCIEHQKYGDVPYWSSADQVIKSLIEQQLSLYSDIFINCLRDDFHFEWFVCSHTDLDLEIDKHELMELYIHFILTTVATNWPDEYELEDIESGYTERSICPNTRSLDICELLDL